MLPIEFDRQVLSSPPPMDDVRIAGVIRLLDGIVTRRVLPHHSQKGIDAVTMARVSEKYKIVRLEDLKGRIRTVSLLTHSHEGWTIHIHELVFDYIAFGIPWDTTADPETSAPEGRKAMAFAEFLLRHEFEHMLRPQIDERMIIASDAEFAMDRRETEPDYYRTLKEALSDPMGGLKGSHYLTLLDLYERNQGAGAVITEILLRHAERLAEVPSPLLRGAFRTMGHHLKCKVIEACYRMSRNTTFPLVQRSGLLHKVLLLFIEQLKMDIVELEALFKFFTDRWGVAVLLHEVEVPDTLIRGKEPDAIFEQFVSRLKEIDREEGTKGPRAPKTEGEPPRSIGHIEPHEALQDSPRQSLNDRVKDARKNPLVPRSVIEVIDKNQAGLKGHSAAKYTELVDMLLAVPWGRVHAIDVGPKEFATGLDVSHYGLQKPKEIATDFFSNLIWRYRNFDEDDVATWQRTGSAFLFVGPPGVGKTSLAISIARNLGIPYHKVSLGGMRDESDLRGHGFTYEGSKPGAIVQGLIKMGVMNGMFILDEADKTEKFAIATLLEILDPEQNHLFHDKYIQTTVDIDLSNCHFILTANTLDTVPEPVIDRCQVVKLNRYSVEEKIAIAREHTLPRIRKLHDLDKETILFETGHESEHLRDLIRNYTHEAGVRQLEVMLRTLFLRVQRREIFDQGKARAIITHQMIRQHLEQPSTPRLINEEDRVGEVLGLGVDVERGIGSVIPIQATSIRTAADETQSALSMVHATGNIEKVMDESRKVATTGILHCAEELSIYPEHVREPVHLHFMGGSTRKDGPSAGSTIGIALASFLSQRKIRRDIAITGEIDTQGRITGVGGLDVKLETAASAGCKTVIIPADNLTGPNGVERFPEPLKKELQILSYSEWQGAHEPFDYKRHVLQVVAVDHIVQAMQIAAINDDDIDSVEKRFVVHAKEVLEASSQRAEAVTACPKAIFIKEAEGIGKYYPNAVLCQNCEGCRLLVPRDLATAIKAEHPNLDPRVEVLEYDPNAGDLTQAASRAFTTMSLESDQQVALVAPFFMLQQIGIPRTGTKRVDVRRYASNYAVQGVKLKQCKALLNRTYCRISHLGPEAVDTAPFLTTKDDITMVDLSPIPEKYRLLVPRAEEILNRSLGAWLRVVEQALENQEPTSNSEPAVAPSH